MLLRPHMEPMLLDPPNNENSSAGRMTIPCPSPGSSPCPCAIVHPLPPFLHPCSYLALALALALGLSPALALSPAPWWIFPLPFSLPSLRGSRGSAFALGGGGRFQTDFAMYLHYYNLLSYYLSLQIIIIISHDMTQFLLAEGIFQFL